MSDFIKWLEANPFIGLDLATKLLGTLAVTVIVWLLRRWILALSQKRFSDPKQEYNFRRKSAYTATILAILVIGIIWLDSTKQIVTYLGILSAGLAIALREPLTNLVGWAYILWQRPFKIGDRIQIGQHAGDVIDINLFQLVLMEIGNWVGADQSTGRIIHIPNSTIFVEPQANYTEEFEFLWNEIPITVTYESDWQAAKAILLEIAEAHAAPPAEIQKEIDSRKGSKYLYFYTHVTPIVYTSIADIGVTLTTRYMCRSRERRSTAYKFYEDTLKRFNQTEAIDFAYPTRRTIVDNSSSPFIADSPLAEDTQKP